MKQARIHRRRPARTAFEDYVHCPWEDSGCPSFRQRNRVQHATVSSDLRFSTRFSPGSTRPVSAERFLERVRVCRTTCAGLPRSGWLRPHPARQPDPDRRPGGAPQRSVSRRVVFSDLCRSPRRGVPRRHQNDRITGRNSAVAIRRIGVRHRRAFLFNQELQRDVRPTQARPCLIPIASAVRMRGRKGGRVTMIYTHVLSRGGRGVRSSADVLAQERPQLGASPKQASAPQDGR